MVLDEVCARAQDFEARGEKSLSEQVFCDMSHRQTFEAPKQGLA